MIKEDKKRKDKVYYLWKAFVLSSDNYKELLNTAK